MTTTRGGEPYDWSALVPYVVHPLRVAIIEALSWIDRPLSATDLRQVFSRRYSLSLVSYHLVELARFRALKVARRQKVRGATEKFYFFR